MTTGLPRVRSGSWTLPSMVNLTTSTHGKGPGPRMILRGPPRITCGHLEIFFYPEEGWKCMKCKRVQFTNRDYDRNLCMLHEKVVGIWSDLAMADLITGSNGDERACQISCTFTWARKTKANRQGSCIIGRMVSKYGPGRGGCR